MKFGILIGGNDEEVHAESRMVGLALTYWRRQLAPRWHVGFRVTLMLGRRQYGLRISTYSCPMLSSRGTIRISDCVLPAGKSKPPVFQ